MREKNTFRILLVIFTILLSKGLFAQPCTNPVITSAVPATGPVGTTVTITGSGFQAGTGISNVKFGGVTATSFTIISDTSLRAVVPAGANSGSISATTQTCTGTGSTFNVLYSNCNSSSAGGNEIYISELYDQKTGSGGMVELYNPTNNPIVLTGTYILQRYGNINDGSPSNGYILNLNGTIDPESTFLVAGSVPNPAICVAPTMTNNNSFVSGFNDNDKIELLKNGIRIDIAHTPATQPGFTMIRKPDAAAPDDVYNSNAWNITLHNNTSPNTYCDNLGNHGTEPVPLPTISQQPASSSVCPNNNTSFEITVSAPSGFTYQWKVLNAAGMWVNVVNNANYSGATAKKLELTNITASFEGNQYYCVATAGTCILISNVAQFSFATPPLAPVAVTTPATCTTAAIITVTPVAGMTYSIDGITYQAGNVFNNVAANTYNVTVKNAAGCVSPAFSITVNVAPGAPATPQLSQVSPTCTTPTGTITVTPIAGVTYSIDGGAYQASNEFTAIPPGLHIITVKNAAGCTSVNTITIASVPGVPAIPQLAQIPPTCTIAAVITVTPIDGVTYSLDGGAYQASNEFNVSTPGLHTITVKNAAGCTSSNTITVDAAPGAPAAPVAVATPATCTTAGSITVTPVAGMTYSINGTNYQAGNVFSNVAANTYNVTVKNAAGCVSLPFTVTVNPPSGAPAQPQATVTPATCTTAAIITVTPVSGMTYSINGINYVAGNVFNNVAANTYNVTVKNAGGCVSPAFQVVVAPAPTVPSTPVAVVTPATCTTAAIITVTPLTGVTYSIDGTNYVAGNVFNNVAAATYNVTVKNAAGCVSPAFSITVNPAPGAPAAPVAVATPATCTTAAIITVTPVAGVTYSIDGTNYVAGNVFNNVAAATYNVTVKNAAGCVSPAIQVVVAPAPGAPAAPVATVTPATCTTAAIITVTPVAGMTYSIDGTNYVAGNVFNNVAANTYNVTVKNTAGCVSPALPVVVAPAPAIPATPVAAETTATCTTAAIITVTPVAGMTYSIDGINYVAGNVFNNVAPATYNITVKNAAGCISPAFTLVISPAPAIPSTPVAVVTPATCTTAATITVTPVAGVTYSIDGVNYAASNVFNNVPDATYNITVKNAAGCVSPAFQVIIVPGVPVTPVAAVTPASCTTAAIITVTPVAGMTYSIDGANYQAGNVFNNVAAATYNVTVKNAAGCVSAALQVVVAPAPSTPATPVTVVTPATCTTAAIITVTPAVGMTYSIDGVNYVAGNVFNNIATATYNVTVKNAAGCVSPAFQVVVAPPTGSNLQISGTEGCRETISGRKYILEVYPLNGSFDVTTASFEWRNEAGQLLSSNGTIFNATDYAQENTVQFPLEITVKVTAPGGCNNIYTFTIDALFCDVPRGISPNNDAKNDTFDLTGLNVAKLSIFNRYGKEVYSRTNYTNEWKGQGDNGDELPTGTYYYMIETADTSKTGWVYVNREN